MKEEHNCENFRYTAEKYRAKEVDGEEITNFDDAVLVTWCSLCGKKIRVVKKLI